MNRLTRTVTVASVLALTTLGVTACTDNANVTESSVPAATAAADTGDTPGTDASTATETTTAAATSDYVQDIKTPPGSVADIEGARSDVDVTRCEERDGTWQASGTVTNSADDNRSYRVYVAFVDPSATTRGLVETQVTDLAAGATSQWSSQLALAATTDARCVLRVERFVP
jgi:hypothetical protein